MSISQELRSAIMQFMAELPIPTATEAVTRADGVREFTTRWCVSGNYNEGIFASLCDQEDVIEFGLLQRTEDGPVNLLHVTVLVDDDEPRLNCLSETTTELNFDAQIESADSGRVRKAMNAFADGLLAASP